MFGLGGRFGLVLRFSSFYFRVSKVIRVVFFEFSLLGEFREGFCKVCVGEYKGLGGIGII